MGKLVIEDVDEALMRDLASFASENRVAVEAQVKQLLRRAVPSGDRAALVARLDAIAALTPVDGRTIDSLDLLREDRQR